MYSQVKGKQRVLKLTYAYDDVLKVYLVKKTQCQDKPLKTVCSTNKMYITSVLDTACQKILYFT